VHSMGIKPLALLATHSIAYLSNTLYSLKEGEKTRDAPHFSA